MKKNLVVAGALLGAVALLSGCGVGIGFGPSEQDVVSYDVTGSLKVLDVTTDSGDIVVGASDRQGVHVTETLRWRGSRRPETEHPVQGGTLTLRQECARGCEVHYKIEIPRGLDVTADTGSGNVTLRGLKGTKATAKTGSGDIEAGSSEVGELTAETGSGNVTLRSLKGEDVRAESGSGDIAAHSLASRRFTAETGSGTVEAMFDAAPDRVAARSDSGDVTLRLPRNTYALTLDTGSGDKTVQVGNDPASPRKVEARSGSGNIDVLPS
ncbi:DUF4097 family beta strand repeat-containing protein [Streptosporangium pseudovulgare]|uniref:DUF4097 domain-containing protein n=1 Tax=Streptosporangium pseudovulgare TaxID=35765 RepID=A0ABQ2QI80_9ACTN|nr:DUF4097 family beta strand repeat-containing protein [Streptosporangium pseudovulgare]GGP80184.1 hypothetical protein GCM10010140_06050 [Streptosporangium pseudovulgare]